MHSQQFPRRWNSYPYHIMVLLLLMFFWASQAPQAQSGTTPSIIGVWLTKNAQIELSLVCRADGSYARVVKAGGQEETISGAYAVTGNLITFSPRGAEKVVMQYRFVDGGNTLEITDNISAFFRLTRQPTTLGTPAGKLRTGETAKPLSAYPGQHAKTMVFQRVTEKNEKAFTLLVPKGWITEGGIMRYPPDMLGAQNAVDAKADFTIKRDAAGTVMVRWLPEIYYAQVENATAAPMFPPGSHYNNVIAMPKMSPTLFLTRVIFPRIHPNAQNVNLVSETALPKLADKYTNFARVVKIPVAFIYSAGAVTVAYQENGAAYTERLVTVIEDWGQSGYGLWRNRETMVFRTPAGELNTWQPVVSVAQTSFKPNLQWLSGEVRGSLKRAGIVLKTQQEIQHLDQEIVAHRQATNAEIHQDLFLTLSDQEEYVNPFTKEVEVGSNQWKYRWENAAGQVVYTDQSEYNPNHDREINRTDFKRSPQRAGGR